MDLDFGTLFIGVLALLACIAPFALDYRSRKNKEANLLQPLKNFAQQHNAQINDYEVCKDFIIGIDKKENSVFFYKQDNAVLQYIDLDTIQTCKVITSHKTMTNAKGNYKVITKLELSFVSTSKAEQIIEFFNADTSPQLFGEVQVIEKWCKIITNQLKK